MRTFFLLGYDYTDALLQVSEPELVWIGIAGKDLHHFGEESVSRLRSSFADRVLVSDPAALLDEAAQADVVISLGWRAIIPAEKLASRPLWINVHPALLPRYRGFHPVPHVILNGEEKHGLTAHLIEAGVDSGDIILQESFDISPFMTLRSLQHLVRERMPAFLNRLRHQVRHGIGEAQPNPINDDVVIAGRRVPSDSEVDPGISVADLYAHFRASDPERFPTYVKLHGEKVYITFFRDDRASRVTPFDV